MNYLILYLYLSGHKLEPEEIWEIKRERKPSLRNSVLVRSGRQRGTGAMPRRAHESPTTGPGKRAPESPVTGRGKRIKPSPAISTAVVARPVWRTGQQEVVTWSSQGEVPTVNIRLHRAAPSVPSLAGRAASGCCAFVKVLACQASNSGSHEVLVPSGLTPGQYIVRINSSVNSSVVTDSSEFSVVCTGGTPVISGVMLQQLTGARQQVKWSSQGEVPAVDICLHHALGRRAVKTLVRKASNSSSHVGSRVGLRGLTGRPELDGLRGFVVSWDATGYGVKLDDARMLSVQSTNLEVIHEVVVPDGLTPGQYVVRIESSVNSSVLADSAEFTVAPTGALPAISTVAVAHPVWRTGQQEVITWSSQGEVPTVNICLHGPGRCTLTRSLAKVLVCKASNSGSYELLVPGGLTPGQYMVRIDSSVNSSVVADSSEFTIECAGSAPVISGVAIRQQVWHGGSRQQVTWSSQGEVPAVVICLYRAPTNAHGRYALAKVLVIKASNSNSYEVLVPVGLTPGQYIVRIHSSVNYSVIADSAEFTVDDEHRERCVRYALLLLGLPAACKLPYALIRKVAVAAATD